MRLQIPKLLRWKHKLTAGMVLEVSVARDDLDECYDFLARIQTGGRISIPKVAVEILSLTAGSLVGVTLDVPQPVVDPPPRKVYVPLTGDAADREI